MPIYKIQVTPIKLPTIITNFKIPNTNQMSVSLSLSLSIHYKCKYREAIWHSERKERFRKACVLRHRVRHCHSSYVTWWHLPVVGMFWCVHHHDWTIRWRAKPSAPPSDSCHNIWAPVVTTTDRQLSQPSGSCHNNRMIFFLISKAPNVRSITLSHVLVCPCWTLLRWSCHLGLCGHNSVVIHNIIICTLVTDAYCKCTDLFFFFLIFA
jgi:hypothetical protein